MSVIKPALQHPELINYLLGASNYSWLYFRNGDKKLLAKPIGYLEQVLPDFIRVHKTALVNPAYVKSLHRPLRQKMAGEIHLESGVVFPVSRRRWNQVAEALEARLSPTASDPLLTVTPSAPSSVINSSPVQEFSIFLITDDTQNASSTTQMIKEKWPQYQVHTGQQSSRLADLFGQLPESERPTLLFLDARTTTLERLHTLQRLKQDSDLCRIPVILLVSPTDRLVTDGYIRQANSVISMKEGYLPFTQAIERICRFWLQVASLPMTL